MALQRAVYRPRDAEHTVLHQVIALHLEAFLGEAVAVAGDGAGLPQFVGGPAGADHPPEGVDVGYPHKDAYDLSRRLAFARRHGRRVNPRHLDLDVGRRLFAGLLVDPRRYDGFGRRNPEPDERRKAR